MRDAREVRERIDDPRRRQNDERLRSPLGWRTASASDAAAERWYDAITRERFYATVCRRIDEALQGLEWDSARRKARREAVHATLEELGLVERTRGGW